jgi:hypothetical protein
LASGLLDVTGHPQALIVLVLNQTLRMFEAADQVLCLFPDRTPDRHVIQAAIMIQVTASRSFSPCRAWLTVCNPFCTSKGALPKSGS